METLKKLKMFMGDKKVLFDGALFFSALSAVLSMMPYIFIWLIVKEAFTNNMSLTTNINNYSWLAMISAVAGIAVYFGALSLSHLAAFRVEVNIRKSAMKKIVSMPLGFFDKYTSGKIRKVIDENASITHTFLAHQLPDLAGSILMPLISLIFIFTFDWRLGLACMIPIVNAVVVMSMMMGKKGTHFMKLYMDSLEEMNTQAVEYVRGIPVVKVFQQTVYSFKNFHDCIVKYKGYVIDYTTLWEKQMSAYVVLINSFVYFLVPVTILIINNNVHYSTIIINLIFYVLITPIFGQCIMRSMHLNQAMGQAGEAINRLENLLDEEILPMAVNKRYNENNQLEFKKVIFKYPEARRNAVDGISFKQEEGQHFALVGASGSGKTTIAKLLPRFWDISSGEILIGGVNVKDFDSEDLMDKISFVFQNTRLFKTTLLENIRFGNKEATKDEINRAIDLAQCREIVNKLPNGLDTMIGTKGVYLSGGEQQRIALARAILKNASIVVLDEATAFSDPENEYLIQRALTELTRGKTVLMIAHRLVSVMHSDRILVIDEGKIVECGQHDELKNKNGFYSKMWQEYQSAVDWKIGGLQNG